MFFRVFLLAVVNFVDPFPWHKIYCFISVSELYLRVSKTAQTNPGEKNIFAAFFSYWIWCCCCGFWSLSSKEKLKLSLWKKKLGKNLPNAQEQEFWTRNIKIKVKILLLMKYHRTHLKRMHTHTHKQWKSPTGQETTKNMYQRYRNCNKR